MGPLVEEWEDYRRVEEILLVAWNTDWGVLEWNMYENSDTESCLRDSRVIVVLFEVLDQSSVEFDAWILTKFCDFQIFSQKFWLRKLAYTYSKLLMF